MKKAATAGGAALLAVGSFMQAARAETGNETAPPWLTGPVYDAQNPPAGIFDDEWEVVKFSGQKAGYMHQWFERTGDKVIGQTRMVMILERMGSVLNVTEEDRTVETVAGLPLAFRSQRILSGQPVVAEGQGDGRSFQVTLQSGTFTDQRAVALPEGTVMTWGAQRLQRMKGHAPGTQYIYPMYSPEDDLLKPMITKVTIGSKEDITVRGRTVPATRVEETTEAMGGTVSGVSWVTDTGYCLKTQLPMGEFTAETEPATKEEALADFLPANIFTASLIELSAALPTDATTVTYELQRRHGQPLPEPPTSATETSVLWPNGARAITLTKDNGKTGPLQLSMAELAPDLARNSYMDTQDPALIKLAEAGGPAGTAPAAVAQKLRDFVAGYIDKKDMSVGFATASEVAKTHEGDCTEHAVLLAALGRVRGIPTRVVAGLAYMPDYGGKPAILGYHMWAQFYLDGQWRDYDAALPELPGPPRRMGLVASDLNEESMADFSLGLLDWMSDLKVTVQKPAN